MLEVEIRRNTDRQNFFMQVKMAILLDKEIHHGAFLAGSDGKKYWVDLKYEVIANIVPLLWIAWA